MIFVTGRTFEHRDLLAVTMGGRFNREKKRWEFVTMMQEHREQLARTPGIVVTDHPEESDYTAPIYQGPRHKVYQPNKTKFVGDDRTYLGRFAELNPPIHFGFSSLKAMIDHVNATPEDLRTKGWEDDHHNDWRDTPNMQSAINLALNGWPDGVKKAEIILERLSGFNAVQRRKSYSVAGGSVNVGRMLSGNPNHMINRPKQPGKKIITFFCEVGFAARIRSEDAALRAAIIAAMVEILEAHGYQCEVIAVDTTMENNGDDTAGYITVNLKQAGEPLNLNEIVFGLGHASMVRRLCFATITSDNTLRRLFQGMGVAGDAFNDNHPPAPNEFYLRRIDERYEHGTMLQRAFMIWDEITAGIKLPIEIKRG